MSAALPDAAGVDAIRLRVPEDPSSLASPDNWAVYARVMQHARAAGVPFAIGGGMAVSLYTGMWRPGKDIDLYVLPGQREAMIEVTRAAGLADYHDVQAYDRAWIYRAHGEGVIVDVIWALANRFGEVDRAWLETGMRAQVRGERFEVLGPVELIWSKLHVLQRDRCDWPDLLNLLFATGPRLDWQRLIQGLPGDEPVLAALLALFAWVAPGRAAAVPAWVFGRLGLPLPGPGQPVECARVDRLDTRPWFLPDP